MKRIDGGDCRLLMVSLILPKQITMHFAPAKKSSSGPDDIGFADSFVSDSISVSL
jgi:hypothetical protein